MKVITWPVVALIGLGLAAFVGIFALIPENEPAARSGLIAVITVAVGAVTTWVTTKSAREVKDQVAEVKKLVNGNASRQQDHIDRLTAKLPDRE